MEDWYIIVGVSLFWCSKPFVSKNKWKSPIFIWISISVYSRVIEPKQSTVYHWKLTINQGRTNKNPSAIDSRIVILTNNLLVHHESDVIVALPVHPSIQLVCAVIWYIFAISRCCAPQILNALVVLCEKLGPTDDYKPVGSWPAIEAWGHKNVNKLHQMHLLIEI